MLCTKIWERHFISEFTKTVLFFLVGFFSLYVLIDYANQSASLRKHHVQFQWMEVALYYLCDFVQRLDVLLPFALLTASIRTLCTLNVHNELVALMSGGTSLKTLMRPFIIVGLFATALLYANNEWVLPAALKELKHIENVRSKGNSRYNANAQVQHLALEDGSTLIFGAYDSAQEMFYDAYWIHNIDDVYRIKYLYTNILTHGVPEGRFVEHLTRTREGDLTKTESFVSLAFPRLRLNKQVLFETVTPPDEEALSTLRQKLPQQREMLSEKEAHTETAFYRKLVLPWLCLLAVIGPAPFCLRCTRRLPVFYIYAASIFALVAFYLLMSAATLLGKRQVLPAYWSIFPPILLVSSVLLWRFFKLK